MLYLSSYVKWNNFGSVSRVSLTQALFKFEPTNFFSILKVALPIPKLYSDDETFLLPSASHLMYCSMLP